VVSGLSMVFLKGVAHAQHFGQIPVLTVSATVLQHQLPFLQPMVV
jgi:hypothetical protein